MKALHGKKKSSMFACCASDNSANRDVNLQATKIKKNQNPLMKKRTDHAQQQKFHKTLEHKQAPQQVNLQFKQMQQERLENEYQERMMVERQKFEMNKEYKRQQHENQLLEEEQYR